MPYKDPERQRVYQAHSVSERRREWLNSQKCSLCGHNEDLRTYRHIGAPRIAWTKDGPSHRDFRVVCGDGSGCLDRRDASSPLPKKIKHPPLRTYYEETKLRALRKPLESERDKRPVCPVRGPRNGS